MREAVRVIAIAVLVLGAILVVWLLFFFPSRGIVLTPSGKTPDMSLTGQIGDFVGGVLGTIFSFAATLFVVVTLQEQRMQNKRSHFVQSYYEMLHVHSEQVNQMIMHKQSQGEIKGREVFPQLVRHYNTVYDAIEAYTQHILNGGLGNNDADKLIVYLSDEGQRKSFIMRLAYGYFFYGSESYHLPSTSTENEKAIEASIRDIGKFNQFFVEGCHQLLGHYFRHMYQMVQYIIQADCLKEDERYIYAKQLRAQMDDNEQLLLYYNAMSDIGHPWVECNNRKGKIRNESDLCPLTRFRMIKNIPASVEIKGIEPETQFFRDLEYLQQHNKDFFEQRNKQ